MNVTDDLGYFSEERIKVGKEEAGTSAFNRVYDKLQANQDKAQTRQIMEMAQKKIHGRINQWKLIIIVSEAIKNISSKVWTNYFVAVNLYPRHRSSFCTV